MKEHEKYYQKNVAKAKKLDKIIDDNKDSCSKVSDGVIEGIANNYLKILI